MMIPIGPLVNSHLSRECASDTCSCAQVYYPLYVRLDDGREHTVRILFLAAAGGTISVFLDEMRHPLAFARIDLPAAALDTEGHAIAGFTAASGGPGREVVFELLSWQLATAELATAAYLPRGPPSINSTASAA